MENKIAVDDIVEKLIKIRHEALESYGKTKMEYEMAMPKLLRKLYKIVGPPTEEKFKDEYSVAGGCWKKINGYTTDYSIQYRSSYEERITQKDLDTWMNGVQKYRIKRPSQTKLEIGKKYLDKKWNVEYHAYNVICDKYVLHPEYENIIVHFIATRDTNKYELVIC